MSQQAQELRSDLVKSDETVIQCVFERNREGVKFSVKVSPQIEDLIQSWGNGDKQQVQVYGRYWSPIPTGRDLSVWSLNVNPGLVGVSESLAFRIDQPATGLLLPPAGRVEIVNMSFLRLVGASEGDGVTFGVKGVAWSPNEARRVCGLIKEASRVFYVNYLKPVHVVVQVVTREDRPSVYNESR